MSLSAAESAPYVGLRPFRDHERSRFFGRDRDATFLVDKVLSTPLTILYSRSGIGKTSLLNVLVVPELRAEDALVLSFDGWSGAEPVAVLRQTFVAAAGEAGIEVPGAASLRQIALGIRARRSGPIVLVLDQLEVFLTQHADEMDSLRSELGALVRMDDPGVHVLLSLREEFLALLEPFKSHVSRLFASTYRLEPLSPAAVRQAIVEPAREVGVEVPADLIEAILEGLHARAAPDLPGGEALSVELPFLQLVCRRLWEARAAKPSRGFSLALFRHCGGVSGILARYVDELVPREREKALFVARLFQLLAPASGLKRGFSAEDLAAVLDVEVQRVARELRRLATHRLLTVHTYRQHEVYELEHDALIRILAPWAQKILAGERVRAVRVRRLAAAFAATTAIVAVAGTMSAVLGIQQKAEYDLRENTEERIRRALEEAPVAGDRRVEQAFTQAAAYVLMVRPDRLAYLADVLQRYQGSFPQGYGWARPEWSALADNETESPLTVRVNPANSSAITLGAEWPRVAAEFWSYGLPVPRRLNDRWDDGVPPGVLEFQMEGGLAGVVDIPPFTSETVAVEAASLPPEAERFYAIYKDKWSTVEPFQVEYVLVPKWSIPVWVASGVQVYTGGLVYDGYLATKIAKTPELALPPGAVAALLRRAAAASSDGRVAASEALRCRGPELGSSLLSVLGADFTLVYLPEVLETASEPALPAGAREGDLDRWRMSRAPRLSGRRLGGPCRRGKDGLTPAGPADSVWEEAVAQLPPILKPNRVGIGSDLIAWWTEHDELRPETDEALRALRERLLRRTGIEVRGFNLQGDPLLPHDAATMAFFHQDVPERRSLRRETALKEFSTWAEETYLERRAYAVTSEFVEEHALAAASGSLRAWVAQRYSVADVRTVFRGLVASDAPGSTVARADWLLGGLVLAGATGDPYDAGHVVEELRALQVTREQACATDPGPVAADWDLDLIIAAIDTDTETAEQLIARALARDPSGGRARLMRAYAAESCRRVRAEVERVCAPSLAEARLAEGPGVLDVDDALTAATQADSPEVAHLLRCAWEQHRLARHHLRAAELAEPLARVPLSEWSEADAEWFIRHFLHQYRSGDPDTREHVEALLLSLLAEYPASSRALAVRSGKVSGLIGMCEDANWVGACSSLQRRVAAAIDLPTVQFDLGVSLLRDERGPILRSVEPLTRPLVERLSAGEVFGKVKPDVVSHSARWARASAAVRIVNYGEGEADLVDAEQELLALRGTEQRRAAEAELVTLYLAQDRDAEAEALVAGWEEGVDRLSQELTLALRAGDTPRVESLAKRAFSRTNPADLENFQFLAAFGGILSHAPDWQRYGRRALTSRHPYVHYVRILLASFLSHEDAVDAWRLLDQQWARVDRSTWSPRLKDGDVDVWREMLVGYYVGQVPESAIFDDLDSVGRFGSSSLSNLPLSRRGLRTEASFYQAMRRRMEGDRDGMRRSLETVVEVGVPSYYETAAARYLLKTQK